MENKITKNLIILGAIIFSFALTNSVSAYAFSNRGYVEYNPYNQYVSNQGYIPGYYQTGYSSYNSNNNNIYNPNPTVVTTQAMPPVVNNYYYPTTYTTPKVATTTSNTNNTTSTTQRTYTNNQVAPSTSNTNTVDYNNSGYSNSLGASAYNSTGYSNQTKNSSKITALSLRGSGSFMPSSIWQWILVVILILAIIVIARMFVRKPSPGDHDAHMAHTATH
ncbi:MAG: hypothetical protein WCT42_03900 [Candidatus Paceibacterota bacterium]